MTKILMRVNLAFTFIWILLLVPTLLWWKASILWVAVMSIWANVAAHFAAYIAARMETKEGVDDGRSK